MDIEGFRQVARTYRGRILAHGFDSTPEPSRLLDTQCSLTLDLGSLIKSLNLSEPKRHLQREGKYSLHLENAIVIQDYLVAISEQGRTQLISQNAAFELRQHLIDILLPAADFAEPSAYDSDSPHKITEQETTLFYAFSYYYLRCLKLLRSLDTTHSKAELRQYYISLAVFTDPEDPWTSTTTYRDATISIRELEQKLVPGHLDDILSSILREEVKPSFARTKQEKLTEQGRKAIEPVHPTTRMRGENIDNQPWKYSNVFIPTLLRHVLKQLSRLDVRGRFIERNWPLIVPPILALIDDPSVKYKVAGCRNLETLLKQVPTGVIDRTGLGEVFQNAIMPCLMYLPTLTEEAASIALLNQAYPVLLSLTRVRFPDPERRARKIECLDLVMRAGIFKAFSNAGEHVRLAEVLMRHLAKLIRALDTDSVKHLSHVVEICSATLSEPLAVLYPPLQVASLHALEQAIEYGWPRITYHQAEILKGLTICWLRFQEEDIPNAHEAQVRDLIKRIVRLLFRNPGDSKTNQETIRMIVSSDLRIGEVLKGPL